MLGGDCTTGVGTVAGLIARGDEPGLVYLDRHADLNVPSSTIEGALDWMGVAHLLDVDGATDELAGLAGARPMLTAGRLAFLALAPVTPFEAAEIERRGPHVVGLERAIADPEGAAREALAALGAAVVAVHFDVDVLDFRDAPLAENTDRAPGLPLAAAGAGAGDAVRRPARGRADRDRVQPAPRRRRRRRHPPPDRGPRRRPGVAPRATIAACSAAASRRW